MHSAARRDIVLELDRAACALIVEGLAERPFRQVFELIGQLHGGARADDTRARFAFSAEHMRLILETLGGMPFARVCVLLQDMQQQMRAQQP